MYFFFKIQKNQEKLDELQTKFTYTGSTDFKNKNVHFRNNDQKCSEENSREIEINKKRFIDSNLRKNLKENVL